MADPYPLVPAEVDLRGYAYMPLDVVRLMRSSTWRKVRRHPELGYWMMNLWASSWHEVPAASLPDDDDELADFARCEPKVWDKVRNRALAGWVKCSDGRLYHPVVAEKALEAWGKMTKQRKQTHAAREALKRKLLEAATRDETEPATRPVTETETASNREERRGTEQRREELSDAAAASSAAAREAAPVADPTADLTIIPQLDRQVQRAFAVWNAVAQTEGWPMADLLTSTRAWRLQQILRLCDGVPGFEAALECARTADFLHGTDARIHRWFDLDWLLDEQKFTRLMEGRYAERHDPKDRAADSSSPTVADGVAAAFARRSIPAGG